MAAADPGGPGVDLYQLLGVPREASREAIAQAWRRRARAEHPDSRPGDAAAASRFRDLAGAWHVLGDPARRAAYDQGLAREQSPAPASRPPGPAVVTPAGRMPGSPPLWAGPVLVEGPHQAPAPGRPGEEAIRLALAGLTLRYLARDWDWPW
jgi:curved DNA-binding protein CbpA